MQAEFLSDISQALETTETCETSPPCQAFGSSPAAARAKTHQSPANAEARRETVISGRKWLPLLKDSDLLGLFTRTLLTSPEWYSTSGTPIWKCSGIKQGHLIFRLLVSGYQRWNGTSGLLPRLLASDWKGTCRRAFRDSPRWDRKIASGGRLTMALRDNYESPAHLNPSYCELLKGFPLGWTELDVSETQSRHQSPINLSSE